MIKVILWDIDATLLDFLAAEKAAIRTCFSHFHLGTCTDEMLARYSVINRKYWERLERGEMTKQQILDGRFREFFQKEGILFEDISQLNRFYQLALGDTICFLDDGFTLIQKLKPFFKQYAVTNGTLAAQEKKLEKSGLGELFDGAFISDEIGYEKPSKEFFDHVFCKIGNIPKEEILIIGDSLTSDMAGGFQAGIPCCWYNPKKLENTKNIPITYEIQNLWDILPILQEETPSFLA